MKRYLYIIVVMFAGLLHLVACSKSDEPLEPNPEFNYGAEAAGDIALICFGDEAGAAKRLKDEGLITASYSLQSNTDEEIRRALDKAQNGAIVYIVADCSPFGSEMPTKASDDLKAFWQEWCDGNFYKTDDKTIVPIWIVNMVGDRQGKDIFGTSMGAGWYMMTTDLCLPQFYIGETLDKVNFKRYVPRYVPYRFNQEALDSIYADDGANDITRATRAEENENTKVATITKEINVQYYYYQPKWGTEGWANPKVSRAAFKFNPKYLHAGLPDAKTATAMKNEGGAQINTKFTVEVGYLPGNLSEKVVKVTAQNGYHIIPNWEWSDVMSTFVHTGDAFMNYLLRSYKVDIVLRHADGVVDLDSRVPDVETKDYKFSETKGFNVNFGISAKASEKGVEGGASLGLSWSSSESISYDLKDMYISSLSNIEEENAVPVSWIITPQLWYRQNAFINDDKRRALNVYEVLAYGSLSAGNSDVMRPIRGVESFPAMNFDTNKGAKQVAVFHVKNSTGDLYVDMQSTLEIQHTNFRYRAGHQVNYTGENVDNGAICTKINLSTNNSNCKKTVKISFGTPKIFPAFEEVK